MKSRIFMLVAMGLLLCGGRLRAEDVTRQVQEELRKRNLYFGDIDGLPSPGLAGALAAYQQRKGFPATGALDEETLNSFGMRPPAAVAAPWPDVPVLKSDLALQTIPPPAFVAPPPAAASVVKAEVDPDRVRLFVEKYLLAGQTNDPAAEAALYADHVDYFDDGKVSRAFIERDIRRYDARWPERYFTLLGGVHLLPTEEPGKVKVEATYRFNVKGHKYSVVGRVRSTYTLAGDRPEDWRIVRVKERRMPR